MSIIQYQLKAFVLAHGKVWSNLPFPSYKAKYVKNAEKILHMVMAKIRHTLKTSYNHMPNLNLICQPNFEIQGV